MKRNYLFFWFAVLLLLFSPARSYAEVHSGTCGENVNWTLDTETGEVLISGFGEMWNTDYSFQSPWHSYRSFVKTCTIEEGITTIRNYLFYDNSNLRNIKIPNSITSIGEGVFERCNGLTSICIPKNTTLIGAGAFNRCNNLESIVCLSTSCPEFNEYTFIGLPTTTILYYLKGSDYSAWAPYFAQMIEMDETGINAPKVDKSDNTTYDIYDMSGRTVRKAATTTDGLKPGLYIINGKKVLVK